MYKQKIILISLVVLVVVVLGAPTEATEGVERTISLDLRSTPDEQLFYVEVEVGEGARRQPFNLLVATTYPMSWLPSLAMSPNRGYANVSAGIHHVPDYLSDTGTGYGGQWVWIHSDTWQVGPQRVEGQQFGVVSPRGHHSRHFASQSRLDGMLGLNGYQFKQEEPKYLFDNLYNSSYIDHLSFSLYINNTATSSDDHSDEPKGALVFGGIDRNHYTGEFNYAKMYDDPLGHLFMYWLRKTLIISGIELDWSRVGQETRTSLELAMSLRTGRIDLHSAPVRLTLDSTTKLFIGDKKQLDKIHLDIIGASLMGEYGVYVFHDCHLDNKPDLVFSVDGLEFKITPEDYVLHPSDIDIETPGRCLSAFKPYQSTNGNIAEHPIWVFGTRFLRNYYTHFDFENDVVGFAQPK